MSPDARFWRNAVVIAVAHVALVIGILRGSKGSETNSAPADVVWLTTEVGVPANSPEPTPEEIPAPTAAPTVAVADSTPPLPRTESEIDLVIPTPTPSPLPTATAVPSDLPRTPTPKPKATAKPVSSTTPKAKKPTATPITKPKPKASAKPSPNKSGKAAAIAPTNRPSAKTTSATGTGSATDGINSGAGASADSNWYGNMLQDRFTGAWIQPTSVKAAGEIIATAVQIRIEKDGSVTRFEIVKPSGNIVVDESVRAVAGKVTRVDPLPKGLGGDHYDVTITFKWNPKKEGGE